MRFKVIGGEENLSTRPAVFVGNHQTALDVLFLGTIFPKHTSVTAKASLKKVPFLGWFMALSGTVFIDRANRDTALKAFEGAANEIRTKRQSVFIFPEGTRSNAKEPMLLGFKKGAFHLAIQAKVPIVPVIAGCYAGVLGVDEWRFRAGTVPVIGELHLLECFVLFTKTLVVLPPIPTDNLTAADVDQLTQYTRDLMLKALIKLTESPRGQQSALAKPGPLLAPIQAEKGIDEAVNVASSGAEPSTDQGLKSRPV